MFRLPFQSLKPVRWLSWLHLSETHLAQWFPTPALLSIGPKSLYHAHSATHPYYW